MFQGASTCLAFSPLAINHFALHHPPLAPLVKWGHCPLRCSAYEECGTLQTRHTHTHTEENSSPKAGPYSQCVNVQKKFFKASHKQYCCLNRTELLSGALWDVGGVMMWAMGEGWGVGGLIQYFLTFMIHCYDLHLKNPQNSLIL